MSNNNFVFHPSSDDGGVSAGILCPDSARNGRATRPTTRRPSHAPQMKPSDTKPDFPKIREITLVGTGRTNCCRVLGSCADSNQKPRVFSCCCRQQQIKQAPREHTSLTRMMGPFDNNDYNASRTPGDMVAPSHTPAAPPTDACPGAIDNLSLVSTLQPKMSTSFSSSQRWDGRRETLRG